MSTQPMEIKPGKLDDRAGASVSGAAVGVLRPRAFGRRFRATVITYALLTVGGVLLVIPFYFLISNSLKTDQQIASAPIAPPDDAQWKNYPRALEAMGMRLADDESRNPADLRGGQTLNPIARPEYDAGFLGFTFPALANTVFITTCCVVLQVISCSMVGYGFARYRFRGRGPTFAIMLATMMLPAQVTMIPVFLLFRAMGWIDTFLPLIIPAMFGTPFFIFMFRQFFLQVPEELLEAARIDGASPFMIYLRLMLPLSTPVIAIVAIYTFMFTWNDFMAPLIYLNSPENRTLALALNAFSGQYGVQHRNLLMAASFVTMLPCIVLFFAAQRYFVSTETAAGLKG